MEKDSIETNNKLSEEEDLLLEIISLFKKYKYFIASTTLIITLSSIVYSLVVEEVFRAQVIMVSAKKSTSSGIQSLSSNLGTLSNLAGLNISSPGEHEVQTNLAILKSRSFNKEFLEENKISRTLFHDRWNDEKGEWKKDMEPTEWEVFQVFSKMHAVDMDIKTGLITYSIDYKDAKKAAIWANKAIEELNSQVREQEINEAEKNLYYLKEELEATNLVAAQLMLSRLMEEEEKKKMLANVKKEYAFKVIDPAFEPKLRFKPKRKLIVILSFIGSLFFSIVVSFGFFFYKNFRSKLSSSTPDSH